MRGKLITIEGTDGSGKNTQAKRLKERLEEQGIEVKVYSFPCYEETFFGREVGAYLRGEFGWLDDVHPKLASLLFAGDRFQKKADILADLESGVYVICDRYIESNMGYQCAKLEGKEQIELLEWLEELEYGIYAMPRPDVTFFLNVPIEVSKELVLKKAKRSYTDEKEDIHEAAHDFLKKTYALYGILQEKMKWTVIDCVQDGNMRSIEDISDDVLGKITSL